MKLKEMLKKVLALIEELNPESALLTDDPDIAAKIRDVINQVMFECARMKKIPKLVVLPVTAGQILEYDEIANACGFDIYQVVRVAGVNYELWAGGTVLEILDSGTAKIDVFIYPKPIGEDTNADEYEFVLSRDVLEIMPYGVAADLLKTDVSSGNGEVFARQYKEMLQRLDPRYHTGLLTFEGGVTV